jgi:hypothetical protein
MEEGTMKRMAWAPGIAIALATSCPAAARAA